MTQLALRLTPSEKRDAKARHIATAKQYAKRFGKTKNRKVYALMILHLKAALS